MNRHRRALQQIAEARPAVLDGAPDRPAPHFPDATPHLRRTPRHRLVLAGLVPTIAAAAVAVAVVVSTSDSARVPQPPQTQAETTTAQGILLAAAAKTATGTQSTGAYWVTKIEFHWQYDVGDYNVVGRMEHEQWHSLRTNTEDIDVGHWLGAAPETGADRAAWEKAGSPTSWVQVTPDGKPGRQLDAAAGDPKVETIPARTFELLGKNLTYAEVQALPTDPGRLKAYLLGLDPKADADLLFSTGADLLLRIPASPQVRAATYRMLAEVPGLRVMRGAQDPNGRKGVAVVMAYRNEDGSTHEVKLIIDPDSGALLAEVSEGMSIVLLDERYTDETPPKA